MILKSNFKKNLAKLFFNKITSRRGMSNLAKKEKAFLNDLQKFAYAKFRRRETPIEQTELDSIIEWDIPILREKLLEIQPKILNVQNIKGDLLHVSFALPNRVFWEFIMNIFLGYNIILHLGDMENGRLLEAHFPSRFPEFKKEVKMFFPVTPERFEEILEKQKETKDLPFNFYSTNPLLGFMILSEFKEIPRMEGENLNVKTRYFKELDFPHLMRVDGAPLVIKINVSEIDLRLLRSPAASPEKIILRNENSIWERICGYPEDYNYNRSRIKNYKSLIYELSDEQ